jgi:Flp pilus assembly protein TadD
VLDFGLSKLIHLPLGASLQTQPGRIMGTPLYMPPEQGTGEEVDHRSDLYSAGLILYEMIAGESPFQGSGIRELLVKQATESVPPLADTHPELDVPSELDDVIAKALEKERANRFQSALEMSEALDPFVLEEFEPRASTRVSKRPRRQASKVVRRSQVHTRSGAPRAREEARTKGMVVPIAIAAGVLAAALGWFLFGKDGTASSVPRASMRTAQERSEPESRYVGLLDETRVLLKRGEGDSALTKIEEAALMECRDSEVFLVRAEVYSERGEMDAALADYEEALRIDPQYGAAAAGIGWIHLERNRLSPALARFEEAAKLEPTSADGLAGQGAVLFKRSERARAKQLLNEAKQLDANHGKANYYLGLIALAENDPKAAIEALVQARRNDPRSWMTLAALGEAYLSNGRVLEAETQLREAVRLNTSAAQPLTQLAGLLVNGGQFAAAAELLESSPVRRAESGGPLNVLLGTARLGDGDSARAIAALERSLDSEGQDPHVRILLGILLIRSMNTWS